MTELAELRRYRATVRIRRNGRVKPECEKLDGYRLVFTGGWLIDEEDSAIYAGERAMLFPHELPPELRDLPIGWIASGDLVDIEPT
jgi:hypothetical protein